MSIILDEAKLALIVRYLVEDVQSGSIPQETLDRVWPVTDSVDQKNLIVGFANRHGWEVTMYLGPAGKYAEFTPKDPQPLPPASSDHYSSFRLMLIEMARAQRARNQKL